MSNELATPSRLPEMGNQLEEQFERTHPAMKEIVVFWAMVEMFREEATRIALCDFSPQIGRHRPSREIDLKNLFAKYAPSIDYKKADRYHCVGRHIASTFKEHFPETLLRKIEISRLAAFSPGMLEKIDRRLPKKQKQLFDYADGKSQRSWLDQFRENRQGGRRTSTKEQLTPEEARAKCIELAREWAANRLTDTYVNDKMWRLVPDHEAAALAKHLQTLSREIREWIAIPPRRREAMSLEEVLETTGA